MSSGQERRRKAEVYSFWLAAKVAESGRGIRSIGREADPENPEHGYRTVKRHLRGTHYPAHGYRAFYESLFGPVPEFLTEEPEDEEDRDMMASLDRRLAAVRREHVKLMEDNHRLAGELHRNAGRSLR